MTTRTCTMNGIGSLILLFSLILGGCTQPAEIDQAVVKQTDNNAGAESDADSQNTPDDLKLAGIDEPRGIRINTPDLLPGYVLFTPMISDTTYLINRAGLVVHTWQTEFAPSSEYLLADGHLLRGARVPDAPRFNGGGQGGGIEKIDWDGQVVWSFEMADETGLLHHDFAPLPNGNILSIAWENRTAAEALGAGRSAEKIPAAGVWPDIVVEIEPTMPTGGNIVWQWHSWDHMVQNQDPTLPNHGDPATHPEKIDINAGPPLEPVTAEQLADAKVLGQVPPNATVADRGSDIHHSNAINYNAELDQIALSVRTFSEIWIIDHALSTREAAGSAGDLLYRWGNPEVYGRADESFHGLGHQHDIRWIPAGLPGAGNLLAFSNEAVNAAAPYSQVVEFSPPLTADGRYTLEADRPFGPAAPVWTYSDDGFFSPFISGAHRLANGNTLINFGPQGRFVEVNTDGEIVWEYWSPYSGEVRLPDGSLPQPGRPFMYAAFRATFIPADHPALAGRDLVPLDPQPALSVLREEELAAFRKQ